MAAPLFAELQATVDDLAGFDVTPTERDALLNEAHLELCIRAEWTKALREIGPTVTDQEPYTFPADVRRILNLSVGGYPYADSDHESVQRLKLDQLQLRATGVWWISYSTARVRSISIYPTSTSGSSILAECVVTPAVMTAPTDEPEVPPEFRQALPDYVGAIALGRQEDDPEARLEHMDEFERQVQRLRELDFSMAGDGILQQQVSGVHF